MKVKSLYDISWQVDEPTYREDSALSYSTLATYERGGFNELDHLFDRKETASLTFGSAVDSIITGGENEFNSRFMVADFPEMSDTMLKIVKKLFAVYGATCNNINDIQDSAIKAITDELDYGKSWAISTVANKVKAACSDYYALLFLAGDKTILSSDLYSKVIASVRALKDSPATKYYFAADNPFDDSIERLYQLKFKANFDGVDYRCMMDEVVVDHKNLIISPVDLKTSSHFEWDFPSSFIQWSYMIQAKLYAAVLKANLEQDEYFKDFTIEPYRFIVVNKDTLTPLVWKFNSTFDRNPLKIGDKEYRHPFEIGMELKGYLENKPKVPNGISETGDNIIEEWLK